jgi:hypothetical protein
MAAASAASARNKTPVLLHRFCRLRLSYLLGDTGMPRGGDGGIGVGYAAASSPREE